MYTFHLAMQLIHPEEFSISQSNQSLFFNPVDSIELLYVISSLKNKASTSTCDGVNSIILKQIAPYIADVLVYIFNLSLTSGVFPNSLKTAIIIPLHKKGDKTCLNNYRPISLLSIFTKILEKVVKRRLLEFLEKNKVFSECQYGFRENRGTEDALFSFLSDLYNGLNKYNECVGLFVDISKAFDMVDHQILLAIMESIGIRGIVLEWFVSYLDKRVIQTKIDSTLSDKLIINIGVPQGSVLGPILFLIYTNTLLIQTFRGKLVAFADDIAFFYESTSIENIQFDITHDLQVASKWLFKHCLIMSDKTKLLQFKLRIQNLQKQFDVKYHIFDCCKINCTHKCFVIENVTTFKYLGVLLDSELSWKPHCTTIKKYIYMAVCKFFLLRTLVPVNILNKIYYALIQSKISYGLVFWGGTYEVTLKPLYVAQNIIIKTMYFKKKWSSSWPLYVNKKILPLKQLYIYIAS